MCAEPGGTIHSLQWLRSITILLEADVNFSSFRSIVDLLRALDEKGIE